MCTEFAYTRVPHICTLWAIAKIRALSVYFRRDCIRHVVGLLEHLIGQEEQR
jgi:hypothetical protein